MNITGTSAYTNSSAIALQSSPPSPLDASPDTSNETADSSGVQGHHHHRGGHMHAAIAQALQSLGLSAQQQGAAKGTTTSGSTEGDNDGDGGIRKDMHKFMHALFEAVRAENTSSSSATPDAAQSTTGSSSAPGTSFASGLSALISDVSKGSAPTDLQNAFTKLMSDFQGGNNATQSSTDASSSTTNSVTLQSLLTKLQANLGYGSYGSASGSLISTTA